MIFYADIIENKSITRDGLVYKLVLNKPDQYPQITPGQFINVYLNKKEFFLPRPFSICDESYNQLTLVYKVVGAGTNHLSTLSTSSKIRISKPLGRGYTISNYGNCLIFGGGVGIPPMYLLAKKLILAENNVEIALGFNDKSSVYYLEEFMNLGVKVQVSTLDGSMGVKGNVLEILNNNKPDVIFGCGPTPMLKNIESKYSKCKGFLSFEARMACGFGVCSGCSIKTSSGMKKVCNDGPVFPMGVVTSIKYTLF